MSNEEIDFLLMGYTVLSFKVKRECYVFRDTKSPRSNSASNGSRRNLTRSTGTLAPCTEDAGSNHGSNSFCAGEATANRKSAHDGRTEKTAQCASKETVGKGEEGGKEYNRSCRLEDPGRGEAENPSLRSG